MEHTDKGRLGGADTEATQESTQQYGIHLNGECPSLSVPVIPADADNLTAALRCAAAGWYVLPVRRGSKEPGSVVGNGWQHQSSRDPHQMAAWFAGTDHGIALHCGRSGALVFDVDHLSRCPAVLPDTWTPRRISPPGPMTSAVGTMCSRCRRAGCSAMAGHARHRVG